MMGSLYTWSNINVYYASYLKYNGNPEITITDAYFLMPLIALVSNFSNLLGALMENKFKARV